MAEGLLGGALGGEEDKPEVEAPETLAGIEAFAAAIAAKLAGNDPGVARKTEEFLSDQSQLLKVQKKHLEDEHALRLAQLRHQDHLLRGQRLGQAFRTAFQIVIALIAITIGALIAVILHDAFTSRAVVVEPFETPSALAVRGLSGTVVASAVLDELTRLQRATRLGGVRSEREQSSAWSQTAKLLVPETAISINEVVGLLKSRFGQDVHIQVDVVEPQPGSLSLTVRGNGIAARTFTGAANEIEQLEIRAGEYVYAESQPVAWAIYLWDQNRFEEAVAFIKSVYPAADQTDRPNLLLVWSVSLTDLDPSDAVQRRAEDMLRAALKMDPEFWPAYFNLMNTQATLGDEESAWRTGEKMRQAAGGIPGRAPEDMWGNWYLLVLDVPALLRGDAVEAEKTGGVGIGHAALTGWVLDEVLAHDPAAAQLIVETIREAPDDPINVAGIHLARSLVAAEIGDNAVAGREIESFRSSLADPTVFSEYSTLLCLIAPIEESAGHPDKADATLKMVTHSFVDCYRFRGDILDHRGDWVGAQKGYADAVALAPDLPAGYYSWGVALARHGDLVGAEAKLKAANQRGPRWADPLKAWGDVLVKLGKTREALAKYDQALKYAPNWKQLKDAREVLAKQKV